MRIALIHANDGSDVRVGKTCRSLARLGFDAHFIGWDRRPELKKNVDLGSVQAHIVSRPTVHGRGTWRGHGAFVRHMFAVLKRIRPDVVCAVNEELAVSVLPAKGLLYRHLVCEIYDSLSARTTGRRFPLREALGAAGWLALQGADRLIVTDEHRLGMLGRQARKAVVIENVPEDPGPELAGRAPRGPIKIWVAGSLEEQRGLRVLLEAIAPLSDVEILAAGWPYDTFSSEVFVKHPRVDYRGVLTAAVSLELAASCDAVFCCYAPTNDYMINASPNKIHDALSVGRPVLINCEVRLAKWVQERDVGLTFPYTDVAGLRDAIGQLFHLRQTRQGRSAEIRSVFLAQHNWRDMEVRLEDLYRGLAGVRK